MSTINFSQEIKTLWGKNIKDNNDEKSKNLTLAGACVNALLTNFNDEPDLGGPDKLKRFMLAQRLLEAGEIELESEDITLVKDLIAKAYAIVVVGPALLMLEGHTPNGTGEQSDKKLKKGKGADV